MSQEKRLIMEVRRHSESRWILTESFDSNRNNTIVKGMTRNCYHSGTVTRMPARKRKRGKSSKNNQATNGITGSKCHGTTLRGYGQH